MLECYLMLALLIANGRLFGENEMELIMELFY